MRPRPDAAENAVNCIGVAPATRRFNEAAARCRGKLDRLGPGRRGRAPGFNEAAARCRGKRAVAPGRVAAQSCASMRPRPDAAENLRAAGVGAIGGVA